MKPDSRKEHNHSCPKCGAASGKRRNCSRCGLVFAKWDISGGQKIQDERLDPLWEEVGADFGNEELHEAFMDAALRFNRLDYAAFRYRKYASKNPSKKDEADKFLARVVSMAQFQAFGAGEKRKAKTELSRKRLFLWGLFLVLMAALLYLAFVWKPGPLEEQGGRDSDFKPGSGPVNLQKMQEEGSEGR